MLRFLNSVASAIEWAIIAWALLMVTALLDPASADEDKARRLVDELLRELNYRGAAPKLDWVSPDEVVLLCGCSTTRALYKQSHVYLTATVDLDTVFGLSLLVHELQHHIQFMKYGQAKNCFEWTWREEEATAVQNQWLSEHGSGTRSLFVTGSCAKFD